MTHRRWTFVLLFAFVLALLPGGRAETAPLVPFTWEWRNPLPQANGLNRVIYAGGLFVAIGGSGTILTSPDGIDWTLRRWGGTDSLNAIAYGNGRFVAQGEGTTLLVSTDGLQWEQTESPFREHNTAGIAFGLGKFFLTNGENMATSVDGVEWQEAPFNTYASPMASAGSDSTVVVLAFTRLYARDRSEVWYKPDVPKLDRMEEVTFAGDRFFLLSPYLPDLQSSANGFTWEQHTLPAGTPLTGVRAVGFGAGQYVAVGTGGLVLSSSDGRQWTQEANTGKATLSSVAYGNGVFVAVGSGGAIVTSPDGKDWTSRRTGPTPALNSVAYGNQTFVAVGDAGAVLVSPDGDTWQSVQSGTEHSLKAVRFLNNGFVAVGDRGTILTSPDGRAWTVRQVPALGEFEDVAWGEGVYVATGFAASLFTSRDGVTWVESRQAILWNFRTVAYGDGRFVAMGYDHAVSDDGITWKEIQGTPGDVTRLIYDGKLFKAMGVDFYSSPTGLTFERYEGQLPLLTQDWASANGWDVVVGSGLIMNSTDGKRWADNKAPAGGVSAVTYGNGRFVAVGSHGTVLVTSPVGQAPVCGQRFSDVPGAHPFCDMVEDLAVKGLVGGYPDGSFRPEQTVTRAEFAKLLTAVLRWKPTPEAVLPFTDTAGHWAASQGVLQAVYRREAIGGFPDSTFRPDEPVTRAQLIKIAVSAAGLSRTKAASGYRDVPEEAWYAWYAGAAQNVGIIGAQAPWPVWYRPNLEPDRHVTRLEAVTVLTNLADQFGR